jgi:hypothetical protein
MDGMTLTLNSLVSMAWRTVKNPREGATEVLSLGIPREALWPALALVVTVSILLAQATWLLVLGDAGAAAALPAGPLVMGLFQLAVLVLMVFAIFWIGRSFGGSGSFEETILLVTWLQFIMVCLQVVQTGAFLILPLIAGLIWIAGIVLFLWLLTNFVAVLHGFASLGQVFVMMLVSAFGIVFGLSIILTLIGVTVPVVNGP